MFQSLQAAAFVLFAGAALAADITPPQLVSFNISPASFAAASGPVVLTISIVAHDDTGFAAVSTGSGILLTHESGAAVFGRQNLAATSGSPADPVFQFTITIPQFSPPGPYGITLTLADAAGNAATFTPPGITVTQSGFGTISLSPPVANIPAAGGSGSVVVTASSPGLAWFATSSATWLTITAGAAGSGSGAVNYFAAANTSNAQRTATITAAGEIFTAIQAPAANGAILNTTAASLQFSYQVGGAAPAPKTLTAYSGGAPLSFTATASSVGGWLFVSPPSGVTSTILSVWTDPTGLAPGTYTGAVTVASAGSTNGPRTTAVTLTVGGSSTFSVSPGALAFAFQQGGPGPAPQSISVGGGGGGFAASASSAGAWLTVSPSSGATPATLTVSVAAAGLGPGSYSGFITLAAVGSGGSQTIPVSLSVGAGQGPAASPGSLTFSYAIGAGPLPLPQRLAITGPVSGASFSAGPASANNWLTLGAIAGTLPDSIGVVANPAGLAAGVYSGAITIIVSGVSFSVPVTLVITAPQLTVSPLSLEFRYVPGGAVPAAQSVTLDAGAASLAFAIVVSPAASWLSVTQLGETAPTSAAVSVNPSGLAVGTYTGAITITTPAGSGGPRTLPVRLVVGTAALSVSPASLEINYQTGDPNPAMQALSLTGSGGAASFTATASSPGNWLAESPSSGSTPATINVQLSPAGLAPGSYSGAIQIASPGVTSQVVPVTLNIRAPQELTLSARSLAFAYAAGGPAPAAQTLTLACNGSALSFAATASSAGNWITTVAPGVVGNDRLIISVNPAALAPGAYSGAIAITGGGACNRTAAVPVTLIVTAAPQALTLPTDSLSFLYQIGTAAPPQQTAAVSCGTSGASFAATVSTGISWLRATPPIGFTPSTIGISVDPTGLAPGTYSGTVVIAVAGACAGSRTVNVTLVVSAGGPQQLVSSGLTFGATSLSLVGSTSQSVSITCATQAAPFAITAASSAGWLSVTPSAGTTPATLSVSANPAGLAAGTYTGAIGASSAACGSAAPLTVTLSVPASPAAVLTVAPASLAFTSANPAAQTISVTGTVGQPFTLTASNNSWLTVSPLVATSPATVTVSVNPSGLAAGAYSGAILLAANGASQTVDVSLTVSGVAPILDPPSAAAPRINSLLNAASLLSSPLAPGEIISIFGAGLGPTDEQQMRVTAANLVDTSLGGTRVIIDGKPAPVLFSHAGQVNAIVPYSAAGKPTVQVQLEYQGAKAAVATFSVADAAPAVFSIDGSGRGQAAILNEDTSVNSNLNPADRGAIAVLYATGAGQMAPPYGDGAITGSTLARPVLPVSVLVDGQNAVVLYAGSAPGLVAGALQVNFRIPTQVRPGAAVGILLKVGRFTSQSTVTLAIR